MKNIFFDLDGTLTDSGLGITNSVAYALKKLQQPALEIQELELFIGPPLVDAFMDVAGLTKEEALLGVQYYREYYPEKGIFENELYAGVTEMLTELQAAEKTLFLTTSKPQLYAEQILAHFGLTQFFKGIYGASMDGSLSAKGDIIRQALTKEKLSSADTIMVGDREYDIRGAYQNDLMSVGVLYGYGTEVELNTAGAHYFAESPLEVAEILLGE